MNDKYLHIWQLNSRIEVTVVRGDRSKKYVPTSASQERINDLLMHRTDKGFIHILPYISMHFKF